MTELLNTSYPLLHPYGFIKQAISPLKFVKGEGIYLFDENGKRYINAASGIWNLCLGFGNKKVEAAIQDQLRMLSFSPLFYFTHNPAIDLAKKLIKMTVNRFSRVYLTCSGSEGIELAIKMALLYQRIQKKKNKKQIISLDYSYHGTTYAALSASGIEKNRNLKQIPRLPWFKSISSPYCYRCSFGRTYPKCEFECVLEVEKLFRSQGENIAALIIEPVLGSAGNVVPPQLYFSKIQELCRLYDILLIVDEVATGIGRCGEMFAINLFNIEPDMLIISKGLNAGYLPIGAVLFNNRIISTLADNQAFIPHGSSQDGNPISCIAAIATLDYIVENGIINHVQKIGDQLLSLLRETLKHPIVGDIRGIGLMVSLELVEDKKTKQPLSFSKIIDIMLHCLQKGLIVYPFEKGISLFPPFVIESDDVWQLVSIINEVLSENTVL